MTRHSTPTRLASLVLGALLVGAGGAAQAQTYPDRPIRLIVPFAPGGTTDIIARAVGEELTQALGQPVVVENRAGAGGNVGTNAVAKATPDGYTWGMIGNSFAVNPSLYRSLPFQQSDLTPLAIVATSPFVMVMSKTAPFATVPEFRQYAAGRPGEVNYASGGVGTIGHLGAHWLADLAGLKLQHVPYKGAGPALADVAGGHVPLYFDTLTSSTPYLRSGQIRALFITTPERMTEWPDTPTAKEVGFAELTRSAWIGMVVPAATPEPIARLVNEKVNQVIASERFKARLVTLGARGVGGDLAAAKRFIADETKAWGDVVRSSGARAE